MGRKDGGASTVSVSRNDLEDSVLRALDDCQRSSHVHSECAAKVGTLVDEGPEEVLDGIKVAVDKVLVTGKKEGSVERLMKFFALLCSPKKEDDTSCWIGNTALECLLEYVLDLSEAQDKSVRMRVAQLVGLILKNIPDDGQFLSKETWDQLETRMVSRLSDKAPAVRAQAARSLERLQDADLCAKGRDPICNALTDLLQHDSSAEVRKAVLATVMVTKSSLPHIIQRTRDSKEDVRSAAFNVLAKRIHIRMLSIAQRVSLLSDGLKDRSPAVRRACTDMLCGHWVKLVEGQPLELLKYFDVESYEDTVLLALRTLFSNFVARVDSNPCLDIFCTFEFTDPTLALSSEGALYLFSRCESLISQRQEEALEELIPDVSSLCQVIEACLQKLRQHQADSVELHKNQFVLKLLIKIARILDARHDVVGQQNVTVAIVKIANCKPISCQNVFVACFELLRSFHDKNDDSDFCRQGAGIVFDCLEPLTAGEDDEALARVQDAEEQCRAELATMEEKLRQAVKEENYEEAAIIKKNMTKVQERYDQEANGLGPLVDQWRLNRATVLTEALLTACRKPSMVAELASIKERVILPSLQQDESQALRRIALRALALLCQMDKDQARMNLDIFLMVLDADEEDPTTRIDALKAVFDLIMLWGLESIITYQDDDVEEQDPEALDALMFKLLEFMDCQDTEMRLVAAEGFAKLAVVGRLVDVRVIQCLLVLYFHPSSEKDVRLRQCLAVCFPILAEHTLSGREAIQALATPLLHALIQPPLNSPLEEVPVEPFLQYLVYLLSFSALETNVDFALSVLAEIMASPDGSSCKILSRLLPTIKINDCNTTNASLLNYATEKVDTNEQFVDAVARRQFVKWQQQLSSIDGHDQICENTEAIQEWDTLVSERSENAETAQTNTKITRKKAAPRRKLRAVVDEESDDSDSDISSD